MEVQKAAITINGKEHELKLTIGFWRRIKASCGVVPYNIEQRLREDFGTVAPQVILEAIVGQNKPALEEIEDNLDRSVMDIIEQAIFNGMTGAERQLVEFAEKRRTAALKGIVEKNESPGEDNDGKK